MLLSGINDREEEIESLRQAILEIAPDKVQLNTVVRPPADAKAIPLDRKKLEVVNDVFGPRAEIIATAPIRGRPHFLGTLTAAVLEMAQRRPVTVEDVVGALNASVQDVESSVAALTGKGKLRKQSHLGKDYYTA
jgi:wyosine [tRNA(Phe)-imidazoG37] synthetase (radical SAM superfamily)